MIYTRRNSLLSILACALLFSVIFYFGHSFLSKVSINIFTPIIKVKNSIAESVNFGATFIYPKSSLISENNDLKQKISELETNSVNSQFVSNQQSLPDESISNNKYIKVYPISFPPVMPYDSLLIDKGASSNLKVGDKVLLAPHIQVGYIEEVTVATSKVRLLSSSGIKTEVFSLRTSEVIDIEGIGGGNFKVDVPISFNIEDEDLFSLPGENGAIIASVSSIKKDDGASVSAIIFTLPLKINGNSILYVEH